MSSFWRSNLVLFSPASWEAEAGNLPNWSQIKSRAISWPKLDQTDSFSNWELWNSDSDQSSGCTFAKQCWWNWFTERRIKDEHREKQRQRWFSLILVPDGFVFPDNFPGLYTSTLGFPDTLFQVLTSLTSLVTLVSAWSSLSTSLPFRVPVAIFFIPAHSALFSS